jgi:predicted DNA-binding protein (MmcQ/YjbR family)
MTIEDLQSICQKLPGTTTDIKFERHLCFNVGEKIYLITSPDDLPANASFKVSEEDFVELTEREGIEQARYFAKRQWVTVQDISLLEREEWESYIRRSFALVAAKLTKKKRAELGIE